LLEEESKKNPEKSAAHQFIVEYLAKEQTGNRNFDGAKFPLIAFNIREQPVVIISDPKVIQDIFTTQNSNVDKAGLSEVMFQKLLGKSFLFSKADESWRAKRKATSHAFYKDRLHRML